MFVLSQSILSGFSALLSGIPVGYDLMIGTTVGIIECYNLHAEKANTLTTSHSSNIKTAIPYAVDTFVATYSLSKTYIDLTSQFGRMMLVKQFFATLSQVVMADYLTKFFISIIDVSTSDKNSVNIGSDSHHEDNVQNMGQEFKGESALSEL